MGALDSSGAMPRFYLTPRVACTSIFGVLFSDLSPPIFPARPRVATGLERGTSRQASRRGESRDPGDGRHQPVNAAAAPLDA